MGPTPASRQKSLAVAPLNQDNLVRARSLIALYPHKRSALVPLLHLLQEQEGYLSPEGIEQVAELLDLKAAEVRGTASFYDMFHLEPVGRYLVAVCTNIACMLSGAYELLGHISNRLGTQPGGTTEDGLFTLEDAECLALCGNAPCVTVNWRYFGDMTAEGWDALETDLKEGRLEGEVPPHGTLCRVRRKPGLATVDRAEAGARPAEAGTKEVGALASPVDLRTSRSTAAVASTLLVAPAAGDGEDPRLPGGKVESASGGRPGSRGGGGREGGGGPGGARGGGARGGSRGGGAGEGPAK